MEGILLPNADGQWEQIVVFLEIFLIRYKREFSLLVSHLILSWLLLMF